MSATKRMFSKDIVRTDKFLDMSLSTQALYFHLCLEADAKGFVTPKSIMRLINATVDDLNVLIAKNFVIPFESGVIVITDWNVHNNIREDREAKSQYKEALLLNLSEQGKYELLDNSIHTPGVLPHRLDKIRLDKIRLDKIPLAKPIKLEKTKKYLLNIPKEDIEEFTQIYKINFVQLKEKGEALNNWLESKGKKYKNYKALLRNAVLSDYGKRY